MFPGVPSHPIAKTIPSQPTRLFVYFKAPRSNGAEIFEYDVWRQRIRGDIFADSDASDSEPDDALHPSLHDDHLINVLAAIPDEYTRKQAFITSGHSQDRIRVRVDGLRPGSRHQFQLRALNTRGYSPFTSLSNVAKCGRKIRAVMR
jgi:hypothetical protein